MRFETLPTDTKRRDGTVSEEGLGERSQVADDGRADAVLHTEAGRVHGEARWRSHLPPSSSFFCTATHNGWTPCEGQEQDRPGTPTKRTLNNAMIKQSIVVPLSAV